MSISVLPPPAGFRVVRVPDSMFDEQAERTHRAYSQAQRKDLERQGRAQIRRMEMRVFGELIHSSPPSEKEL